MGKASNLHLGAVVVATLVCGVTHAQVAPGHRDAEAVAVLEAMDAYTESLQHFTVQVQSFNDAAIDSSLVIANPSSSEVVVDRPGSLRSITSDGVNTSQIYLHDGEFTLYSDRHNAYANSDVPGDLDEALLFALSEFQVETPLLDILLVNSLEHFTEDIESVIYIGSKRPVGGVNCHDIVVSGPHLDLQIFVEEGDKPVPRLTIMTLKGDLGRPRHAVSMVWQETDKPGASVFEFDAPDGATEVEFIELL